ncbi:hypothetical protein FE257_012908 [Aspergillus nanangensis]|uniref:Uncharacterized protein n=1 Tax=Aspergillus nanangensis TaxID=2582783 RepID=A0AAD4CFQ4_ASPNN|nr:hypothetical protein FE257_012908 [Aspergillus nanangensis]
MSTFFHNALWIDRVVSVSGATGTWRLVEKKYDRSETTSEEDAKMSSFAHFGLACFVVESVQHTHVRACLFVFLHLPYRETVNLPGRLRSAQAELYSPPPSPREELEGWLRLEAAAVGITSRLLGHQTVRQGDEDPVPEGWGLYILVSEPPGVQLGNGINTRKGKHFCPEGIFWDFDKPTRDLIRQRFEQGCNALYDAGVNHCTRNLSGLYWDVERQKLHFHGHFVAVDVEKASPPTPFSVVDFGTYGLAKISAYWRIKDRNTATVQELMDTGWNF